MDSVKEALNLLENTFAQYAAFVENLLFKQEHFAQEIREKNKLLSLYSDYRKITLEKLGLLKDVLKEEIKTDILLPAQKKSFPEKSGKLNIMMLEDE